ncbi:delta-aminolevulinic acid dehydratase/porphobilinogen synthase [Anaerosolibacter carboniphilus]|uniref:Delta-aminolevulinic acid dehydratase/porphobilinogen synthase n=1 Tax=Anaerosolibacter carboniphilus TaxID=1417629 RepID=A0A841L2S4_9FIRM|nr:hypothetical protein [Anaerosolibacter carboniphilus]MBB6216689.1 delta-aminolevulinic acid dehydratase/porphobilinogen synthase [Anaerosolibacter carboniphilus]
MNYYFLFHYNNNTRTMYLVEAINKDNLIYQFMQYVRESNPENIHITDISILHEFRENH